MKLQALANDPAAEPNQRQKDLKKRSEDETAQKHHRHQEMILPASVELKLRYQAEKDAVKKHASSNWAQQLSFDLQIRNNRFLKPSGTKWAAHHEDRKTITEWIG